MSGSEPLHWKPRLLSFPQALELYDYESIERDLSLAKQCFDCIADREFGVISRFTPQTSKDSREEFNAWCVFVSGSIHYRRCFSQGVRVHLSREDIAAKLSDDQLTLHDALFDIANKHVAHSVNEMELGGTTIEIAIDSKGLVRRGGLGSRGSIIGPLGPNAYRAIGEMILVIVDQVVAQRISELKNSIRGLVDGLSDAEILELPEGFPPYIENPTYGKRRKWP